MAYIKPKEEQEEEARYKNRLIFGIASLQNELQGVIHSLAELATLAALNDDNNTVLRLAPILGQLAQALEELR